MIKVFKLIKLCLLVCLTFQIVNKQKVEKVYVNSNHKEYSEFDDPRFPSTFYPIEPGKPGQLVFISGPPCSGKSTTAKYLAQYYGYKYYEADAVFYKLYNPYLPLNDIEPVISLYSQKKLKVRILITGIPRYSHPSIFALQTIYITREGCVMFIRIQKQSKIS